MRRLAAVPLLLLAACSSGEREAELPEPPAPAQSAPAPLPPAPPVPAGARATARRGSEPVIVSPGQGLRPPVDAISRSFMPRSVDQDYVEVVPRDVGAVCALLVQPQVRTPREGPWAITFRAPNGQVGATVPPQQVDPATGYITLVAHAPYFGAGEWTIELDLVEGGRTHGPERQVFRFRVE